MGRGQRLRIRWHEAGVFAEAGRRALAIQNLPIAPQPAAQVEAGQVVARRELELLEQVRPNLDMVAVAAMANQPATAMDLHLLETRNRTKWHGEIDSTRRLVISTRGQVDDVRREVQGHVHRIRALEEKAEASERFVKIPKASWELYTTMVDNLITRIDILMKMARDGRSLPNPEDQQRIDNMDAEDTELEAEAWQAEHE